MCFICIFDVYIYVYIWFYPRVVLNIFFIKVKFDWLNDKSGYI